MKVSGISSVNFKGIKVLGGNNQGNDRSDIKISPQKAALEEMQRTYQELSKANDKAVIRTLQELKDEVDKEAADKAKKAEQQIRQKHPYLSKIGFIRNSYLREPLGKIQYEASNKKWEASREGDTKVYRLKDELLTKMVDTQQDGIRKMDELDRAMVKNILKQSALKYSDRIVGSARNRKGEGFSKVAGYDYEKQVLNDVFISKVREEQSGKSPDIFGSILFFGPYGNGKTYMTKNIAAETGCKLVQIKTRSGETRYKHFMDELKKQAEESESRFEQTGQRTVIFVDEIDKVIGKNSPISKEFEEFIKTCSRKYHCSVFASTNSPSILSVDMDNPEIFPIRMSIDIPDDENMEKVLEHYLKGAQDEPLDYSEIAKELREIENNTGSRLNNSQIFDICSEMITQLGALNIKQKAIINYLKNTDITPVLDKESVEYFNQEYEKFIGRE